MDTSNQIENALDKSIVSDELTNITSELTEVGLDSFLREGLLKDLPIVGMLFGLTKIGFGIQDKIFLKKILRFLFQLKDIPQRDREIFIDKLNNDKKYKTKVGETLILIIDKLNDYSKADFLGKLLANSIKGQIEFDTFLKLSNIIEKCFIPDLEYLIPFYNGDPKDVDETDRDILYNLGLLKTLGVDGKTLMYPGDEVVPLKKVQMEINKYGKLVVELLLLKNNNS